MKAVTLSTPWGPCLLPNSLPLKGLTVFYPPATGDQGQQHQEAASLQAFGVAALLYDAPYRRTSYLQATRGKEIELQMREEAIQESLAILDWFKNGSEYRTNHFAFVGKNLGGSIAALAAKAAAASAGTMGGLVVTGAVPNLSDFWEQAEHPVARQFRQGFSPSELLEFTRTLRPYDLASVLATLSMPTLLQFGTLDPWMSPNQVNKISGAQNVQVSWKQDDHEMNSEGSIQERSQFLETVFKLGG